MMLALLVWDAEAQTNCSTRHTDQGVFICYPDPTGNIEDSIVPRGFHLSAQANAPKGRAIAHYAVLIDNRVVFENRLAIPVQNLSIETNLSSPFDSALHTLKFVVDGAGSAEVKGIQFYPEKNASFCDPFRRFDKRACNIISNIRGPLRWRLAESNPPASTLEHAPKPAASLEGYLAYMDLFGRNLKSIEAGVSDAIAIDAQGNLYAASHVFADVEVRKYAPGGSIVYDSLIRSCGDGFLSVTGLALDNAGRAWIAGNTTACLSTTRNAIHAQGSGPRRTRGFVMLVDTAKPNSTPPLYVTYLSESAYRIAAIRVDIEGNAYVAGTASSMEFPHETSLSVGGSSAQFRSTTLGFISALNASGSSLKWSTLLQNVKLSALVLDRAGNVDVTGRVASSKSSPESCGPVTPARPAKQPCRTQRKPVIGRDDVLVARLLDHGRRLSYVSTFGGSGDEEGRAISTNAQGTWIFVEGATNSPDFPASLAANASRREGTQAFAIALQPCRTGIQYSRLIPEVDSGRTPGIALSPALDAFTSALSGAIAVLEPGSAGQKPFASVQIAPACPAGTR
ncbi:MAG: hypothetical protein ABI165_07770 [Bryobacteraceae bacterium]